MLVAVLEIADAAFKSLRNVLGRKTNKNGALVNIIFLTYITLSYPATTLVAGYGIHIVDDKFLFAVTRPIPLHIGRTALGSSKTLSSSRKLSDTSTP